MTTVLQHADMPTLYVNQMKVRFRKKFFGAVKSILYTASAPTFVTLLGIIQYAGLPLTVTVSLHLTTASNLNSIAATCVHVSAVLARHV